MGRREEKKRERIGRRMCGAVQCSAGNWMAWRLGCLAAVVCDGWTRGAGWDGGMGEGAGGFWEGRVFDVLSVTWLVSVVILLDKVTFYLLFIMLFIIYIPLPCSTPSLRLSLKCQICQPIMINNK